MIVVYKHYKRRWIVLLSFLVIFSEVLEEAGALFFPDNERFFQTTHFFFSFWTILLLVLLLRGINKTTEELQKSNQKLNNIFDTLDVAIWSHDLKSGTLLITPGIEKLYGRSLKEFYQDHHLWKKVIYPDDLYVLVEREQKIKGGETVTSIYRIIRPDGEVRWIQDRGIPIFDEKGKFIDFSSVLFDITDRKESEDRYRSLVEMSPDIIAVVSDGKIDYINEAGSKLVGASNRCGLIGKPVSQFVFSDAIKEMKKLLETADPKEAAKIRFELEAIRLDGIVIDVEISTMPILYEGRLARQVVGRDITDRKKTEKTIHYMAYYDALTGLPNRNMFREHLNDVLNKANHQRLAVIFLDLDRFKIINDTKGHTMGDLLLEKVANRLKETVRNDGLVSRQSGDEFIILLENCEKNKAAKVSERILTAFSKPLKLDGEEFFVTTSIGISMYPDDGGDQETLIKHADTAMYLAKERGKNNFQFYTSSLDGLASRKMELENGLRKALEQNQFILYYQPQVELATGKMAGVEALIRWQHPERGMVAPNEFIPLAEETGLIVPIGKWVLRKACEQNKAWQNEGLEPIPVAVNISVRQIQDDGFVDDVKQILKEVGLDPQYLELEITESIMQNFEKSIIILNQLKQLGLKLSIDDFGQGYSSLSYLKHLPLDNIKIDKLFVDDIMDPSNQGSIAKAIIDMGHDLKFTVIAEGIEQAEQVKFLLQNSCKIGQGYYFSKPLPPEDIKPHFHSSLYDVD
ncbi:diguanylate cyclase (GGDEF)-like protein/PAS domain S-box-containing protein [Bacillus fengqiuensis]|nr:diguanylate cyclase (GGDEF)-like protein/PAS domain S-box-containing protein [Bacillus fengqiuensis]